MKHHKYIQYLILYLGAVFALALGACACGPPPPSSFPSATSSGDGGDSGGNAAGGGNGQIEAGTLTAGSFDDNLNIDAFKTFLADTRQSFHTLPSFEVSGPISKPKQSAPLKKLDLAFVIDTTGSMGDELAYIQRETQSIVDEIRKSHGSLSMRFALILYRDNGEAYVTQRLPFTDSLDAFQANLKTQRAAGGGDYPEAMHKALADAAALEWRGADTAKAMFLLADAPPHSQDFEASVEAMKQLADKGVRLFPVAASGVMEEAEYIMRIGAYLSRGKYLFLTDDSGVGNPHQEPKIPCYDVEKLNKLMVRMINDTITGQTTWPSSGEIIRSVGTHSAGVCKTP